jgi:hypothetical protein
MKIYIPIKLELVRLTIKDEKETKYLNLIDTSHEEAIKFCINTFSNNMFKSNENKVTIDLRHCIGSDNLKSQRVTLFGSTADEVVKKLEKIIGY